MGIKVSAEELLKSGAYFGHQARRWNPKMKPYLYGVQDGVHVFDLIKTKALLEEALDIIEQKAKKGATILILGTKKQVKDKVKKVAEEAECLYVNERWLGGTFTNFEQIKKSLAKMEEMREKIRKGEYSSYTKKERILIEREIKRLEKLFGGLKGMQEIPDLLFVIDTKREVGAIKEASDKKVETIGIVDSNSDPTQVDLAIPMNDDATKALDYVLTLVGEAIKKGKKSKKKK